MNKPRPLDDFRAFLDDYRGVLKAGLLAGVAPLADLVLQVGSPWPTSAAATALSVVVELLVLAFAYEFWRRSRTPYATIQGWMVAGILGFIVSLIIYIILWSQFIVPNDDSFHRDVIGYEMHPQIREMVAENPSVSTPEQLLRKFDRDVEAIWTSSSIRIARAFVLLTWLAIWATVSLTLAAFVSLQYRRADKKKSSPRQPKTQSAPLHEKGRTPAEKDKDTVPDGNLEKADPEPVGKEVPGERSSTRKVQARPNVP